MVATAAHNVRGAQFFCGNRQWYMFFFVGEGGGSVRDTALPTEKLFGCDVFGPTCVGEGFIQEHTRTIFAFSLLEVVLKLFQIMKSCCAFEKAGLRVAKQGISVASIPIP